MHIYIKNIVDYHSNDFEELLCFEKIFEEFYFLILDLDFEEYFIPNYSYENYFIVYEYNKNDPGNFTI